MCNGKSPGCATHGRLLTTHRHRAGRPAAGIEVALCRIAGETAEEIARATTNADGRTDAPILSEADFATGTYELRFYAGACLRKGGATAWLFLDIVPIRFEMAEDAHYHVPLLLSPYGIQPTAGVERERRSEALETGGEIG